MLGYDSSPATIVIFESNTCWSVSHTIHATQTSRTARRETSSIKIPSRAFGICLRGKTRNMAKCHLTDRAVLTIIHNLCSSYQQSPSRWLVEERCPLDQPPIVTPVPCKYIITIYYINEIIDVPPARSRWQAEWMYTECLSNRDTAKEKLSLT